MQVMRHEARIMRYEARIMRYGGKNQGYNNRVSIVPYVGFLIYCHMQYAM